MEPSTLQVLLVAPEETVHRTISDLLGDVRNVKYDVDRAQSSDAALRSMGEEDCDVCLFDPGPDAEKEVEFLRAAREAGSWIPVIVLVGEGEEQRGSEAVKAGAADFLVKDQLTACMLERSIHYSTEQRRLLKALEEREVEARKLSLVAKRTDNAVILTDAGGYIEWVNEGFARITGYTFAEVVGKKPGAILQGPETDPETVRHMHQRLEKKRGFNVEVVNYRKSGEKFWFAIEVQPILGKDGEVVNFMSIESDITERKQNEDALREREGHIRAIVDNLVDGIVTINEKGIVETFSPAAERVFGYRAEEIVGQSVNLLMPEPYSSQHDHYIARYLESGEPRIIGIGREVIGKRKDNSTFPLDLAVNEMHSRGRRLFVGITRDITERKRLEEMKDEFLRVASHDLKNPLGSILGFAQLVMELTPPGTPMSKRSYWFLEKIVDGGRVMKELITDFLDFHALEDGKLRLERVPCDLNEIARGLSESNREYARSKRIDLDLDLEKGLPRISADPARIRQVVQNLIENAVKFSPQGSDVVVSTRQKDGQIVFAVKDSGPGLTDDDLENVFQKYARLSSKPTGEEKSSGLGLAICKQLIEIHGGEIGVRNNPDKGATFWFRLPIQ